MYIYIYIYTLAEIIMESPFLKDCFFLLRLLIDKRFGTIITLLLFVVILTSENEQQHNE